MAKKLPPGYTLTHEEFPGDPDAELAVDRPSIDVTARYNGHEIGRATLRWNGEKLKAANLRVEHGHRRKGVATAMYAYAEKVTGRKVIPSEHQSDDAKALWESNNKLRRRHFGILDGIL